MSDNIKSGTIKGLLDFIEHQSEWGLLDSTRARLYRAAILKIFPAVDGDTWKHTNTKDIDLEKYIDIYSSKDSDLTEISLRSYKSRVNTALKMYREYLEPRAPKHGYNILSSGTSGTFVHSGSKLTYNNSSPSFTWGTQATTSNELVTYPFPFSNGQVAKLSLPLVMQKRDVDRLIQFIQSLQFDEKGGYM